MPDAPPNAAWVATWRRLLTPRPPADPPPPPEPIPLPGDLRVAPLVGPDVDPHGGSRWQLQKYDAPTGTWRPYAFPAAGAEWRTFADEATALAYVRGLVRHRGARTP